jgi:hypothetical protein
MQTQGVFEFWDVEPEPIQTLFNLCLYSCARNTRLPNESSIFSDIQEALVEAQVDCRLTKSLERRVELLASDPTKNLVFIGSGRINRRLWKMYRSRPHTRWVRKIAHLKEDALSRGRALHATAVVAVDGSEPLWYRNLQLVNFAYNGPHLGNLDLLVAAAVPFQDESPDENYLLLNSVDRYHDRDGQVSLSIFAK